MEWVLRNWQLVAFIIGQIVVGVKAYLDLRDKVRAHEERYISLKANLEDHLKSASPMMKEFLELQVEFRGLVDRITEMDEQAIRERAEVLARVDAIGASITARIDSLFRMLVEKGKA